jgi:CelD/BcsL family acetyltransferase involved in cellulose biosynthesis
MDAEVIHGEELTASQAHLWSRLLPEDTAFASPFFSPELAAAVAAVRDDVRIAVLSEGGETVGFFPFQRDAGGEGEPLASGISDFHGPVVVPGIRWSAAELLAACGLRSWRFDHLPADQEPFRASHREVYESPYLDLSQGFEEYARQRRLDGSRQILQVASRQRRLEREVGGVRFEARTTDPEVLSQLIRWKSDQYERTGRGRDPFRASWTRSLLARLQTLESAGCTGMLSALWAGGELLAAHLGVRSPSAWHWWFIAYSRSFARHNPGLILLLEMARHAASLGIRRLDLGRGEAHYKQRLQSGCLWVAEGSIRAG